MLYGKENREQEERETSPTSRITSLQEGKQKEKTLMTQRDTQTQKEREEKDSSTRPLLLGPHGDEGKGFTPQNPPDEVAHWVTPLSTCSQTAGKVDIDRQTD